jgi:hypothetical protein
MPVSPDIVQTFFELSCEAAGFTHKWTALSASQKARYAECAETFVRCLPAPGALPTQASAEAASP